MEFTKKFGKMGNWKTLFEWKKCFEFCFCSKISVNKKGFFGEVLRFGRVLDQEWFICENHITEMIG